MIRGMSKTAQIRAKKPSGAGRMFASMGSLLAFAGPARSYRPATAEDIAAAAWRRTGDALRGAMRQAERDRLRKR